MLPIRQAVGEIAGTGAASLAVEAALVVLCSWGMPRHPLAVLATRTGHPHDLPAPPSPLPLPQRRAWEFDEMRDTVDYDLIVVMDRYDRQEVVREVSSPACLPAWQDVAVGAWAVVPGALSVLAILRHIPTRRTTRLMAPHSLCRSLLPPTPARQVSVLERLNPGGAYLTRVHRLKSFARAGRLVLKDRCLLVRGAVVRVTGSVRCYNWLLRVSLVT